MQWTTFSRIYGPLQLLCLLSIVGGGMSEQGEQAAVAHKHAFANNLYKAVAEEHRKDGQTKNLIMSPLSLEIVLSAAGMGARGRTQEQISAAIGLPFDLETMRGRYAPILSGLESDAIKLRVATHMFVQEKFDLKQNFVNGSREVFMCGVGEVDYIAKPEEALSTINGWVNEKTEGLIKELLTSDDITLDTRLVLANAIYFKGKWAQPFEKERTRKDKFNLLDGTQVDVDMMYVEKRFRYGYIQDLKAEVLELPYEGDKLSMVILLPFADSSIFELESKVSSPDFDLSELLANHTYKQEVTVYLPKFKLELKTDLEEVLAKMGMAHMFTDNADFSGITDVPPGLKVGKVVQKAFIEVSEEGTEAAASTGMVMVMRCCVIPQQPKVFKADRPFAFILAERVDGNILFAGNCVNFSSM
ncbi:leukocyte elastase inhibitor-like isoform X5 [Ischnura elegans]|uniref:leukocyte elastase inhibitor-like isoform X5 n=1 Tax=Ischnura elegans TaxID=197161 RepID=UPI001ED873B3|nr:leukocyte elastase inhibitor-like isoform X5 [Ischnura elegans]